MELLHLLALIIIANGAPIAFRILFNDRFSLAVDFGQDLPDNKPLFGPSKTWRGVIAALSITTAAAWLSGYPPATGFYVAVYAVIGDLFSSFVKRRLGMKTSSMAPLLDQIPESLLPAVMMKDEFHLDNSSVLLLVLIFIISELVLSYILYKLGIRRRPY